MNVPHEWNTADPQFFHFFRALRHSNFELGDHGQDHPTLSRLRRPTSWLKFENLRFNCHRGAIWTQVS